MLSELLVCQAGAIVFLDEADAVAYDCATLFHEDGRLGGIYHLKAAHRIYFVSATFSELAKEVIETLLCKSSDNIPTVVPPSAV